MTNLIAESACGLGSQVVPDPARCDTAATWGALGGRVVGAGLLAAAAVTPDRRMSTRRGTWWLLVWTGGGVVVAVRLAATARWLPAPVDPLASPTVGVPGLEASPLIVGLQLMAALFSAVNDVVRTRPDLCLLDVAMPGNGIAACWEITGRLPQTVVVMFTVSAADNDLFAVLRAGAGGYLLKDTGPAKIPDLLIGATTGQAAIPPTLVARMVRHFRHRDPRRRQIAEAVPLTSREREVLELMSRELTNNQIASELSVSPVTVRSHVAAVLRKLRVPDRDAAVRLFAG